MKSKKEKKRSPEFIDQWHDWMGVVKDRNLKLLSADFIKGAVHLEKLLLELDPEEVSDIMDNLYWRVFYPWKDNKRDLYLQSRGYSFQTAYYCREELNFPDHSSEWQDRVAAHGEKVFAEG